MTITDADIALRERELFEPLERVALLPPGSLTVVGLDLTDVAMSFNDWEELGRRLGHLQRWSAWALGDWLNFGESLFGHDAYNATEGTVSDRYDLLTRVTGLAATTLMNYASVCGRVPRRNRRVELYFSTHEPVAVLDQGDASSDTNEQREWLQRAVDERWTRGELRDAIRAARSAEKNGPDAPAPPPRRSLYERRDDAARLVLRQARKAVGGMLVPPEAWAQLVEAYGGE